MTTDTAADAATKPYLDAFRAGDTRWPSHLREMREEARDRFAGAGFPAITDENWRFTNVSPVARAGYLPTLGAQVTAEELEPLDLPGAVRIVVVNGRFETALSQSAPAGVRVLGLSEASGNGAGALEHLGQHAQPSANPFVALNSALFGDAVVIDVAARAVVASPIHLLYVAVPGARKEAHFPRSLVLVGEGAEVTLIETFTSVRGGGEAAYFNCPVTELVAGSSAVVRHYRVERESADAHHLATLQALVGRAASVTSQAIVYGGAIARTDTNVVLAGPGSDSEWNGLYVAGGSQLIDNHLRVEHQAPRCASRELWKGILDGHARAVFNGRLYVHRGAQKTDAKQTNRNLLLSLDALVNSNPQLEIFADDVKCTHGSTTGQLDADAVFYLRSRGLTADTARSVLTYAFAAEFGVGVRFEPLRRALDEFLFARLPGGNLVRQAMVGGGASGGPS